MHVFKSFGLKYESSSQGPAENVVCGVVDAFCALFDRRTNALLEYVHEAKWRSGEGVRGGSPREWPEAAAR
jgi:hypothetical protein